MLQGIRERLAQPGFFRQSCAFLNPPLAKERQQQLTPGLSDCQSLCCRGAVYFLFYRVQLADTFQGFLCC